MKIHPLEVFWAPHHGQKTRLAKKTHHFRPPQELTRFFTELLSFIRYCHTYGQQDSVDLNFYVIKKHQSSPTQR